MSNGIAIREERCDLDVSFLVLCVEDAGRFMTGELRFGAMALRRDVPLRDRPARAADQRSFCHGRDQSTTRAPDELDV